MYTLIKKLTVRELLVNQAPTLVVSLAIAELFFKFGSFLFEALAFLLTWLILDAIIYVVTARGQTADKSSQKWPAP